MLIVVLFVLLVTFRELAETFVDIVGLLSTLDFHTISGKSIDHFYGAIRL